MEDDVLTGSIVGYEDVLTVEEFARACHAEVRWVAELVEVGILAKRGHDQAAWRFCAADLACARRAARLQRDFEASIETVAVMLDLLNEIDRLRERLRRAGLDADG
ncbi:MAG: chaperone modulator CbpM [Nitrospira sp.]|nr:chaperone modulator CbpM [Nitrospira sp.]MCP9464499.1 chaperone modulator CbpM [Nitrospira sp.]